MLEISVTSRGTLLNVDGQKRRSPLVMYVEEDRRKFIENYLRIMCVEYSVAEADESENDNIKRKRNNTDRVTSSLFSSGSVGLNIK